MNMEHKKIMIWKLLGTKTIRFGTNRFFKKIICYNKNIQYLEIRLKEMPMTKKKSHRHTLNYYYGGLSLLQLGYL